MERQEFISEVMSKPVFGSYGRLIFPVDKGYMSGNTLGNLGLPMLGQCTTASRMRWSFQRWDTMRLR